MCNNIMYILIVYNGKIYLLLINATYKFTTFFKKNASGLIINIPY